MAEEPDKFDFDQEVTAFPTYAAPLQEASMSRLREVIERQAEKWRAYRSSWVAQRELASLEPTIAAEIAADAGISRSDLRDVVASGSGAERLMSRMIAAFGIKEDASAASRGALWDAAIVCSRCKAKSHCRTELDSGSARANAHLFCPNSETFEALT